MKGRPRFKGIEVLIGINIDFWNLRLNRGGKPPYEPRHYFLFQIEVFRVTESNPGILPCQTPQGTNLQLFQFYSNFHIIYVWIRVLSLFLEVFFPPPFPLSSTESWSSTIPISGTQKVRGRVENSKNEFNDPKNLYLDMKNMKIGIVEDQPPVEPKG